MNRVSITYHSSSVKNFHQVNDVSLAISAFLFDLQSAAEQTACFSVSLLCFQLQAQVS